MSLRRHMGKAHGALSAGLPGRSPTWATGNKEQNGCEIANGNWERNGHRQLKTEWLSPEVAATD